MRKWVCFMLSAAMLIALAVPVPAAETGGADPAPVSETGAPATTPPTQPHQHTWGEGTVTAPATCIQTGTKTYTCPCGESKTETIAATGHSYGAWTQVDAATHKHVCVCGAEETASHVMSGTVTTEPTCKTGGVKTHTCSGCSYSYTEELPVSKSHTYGEWSADEYAHKRTCTVCGTADSGAHSWNGGVIQEPATCTEEGILAVECSVCHWYLYEILPIVPHTYDNVCDADCNICGAVREAEHKFSTAWSKDYSGHWHACTRCGGKADVGKHFAGPAATEEKAQLCLTCGYTLTPKLNHTHSYASVWSSDDTGHWYACDDCEEQKDFAPHAYDDTCDEDCNICGYQTNTVHSYDGTWLSDESGHWYACAICGRESTPEKHTADPGGHTCSVCDFVMSVQETSMHEHEFPEIWNCDESNHWKECGCGEHSEKTQHSWDDGTENGNGSIRYICSVCQMERNEDVQETEDSFPWLIVLVILLLACAAAVAALIVVLKRGRKSGKFSG